MPMPTVLPESPAPQARFAVAAALDAILAQPSDLLNYARAKLMIDRLVEPTINISEIMSELDRLAGCALSLAGSAPGPADRVAALRRLLHESGPWNAWRPFDYDQSNLRGRDVRLKLLACYLRTRLGDCVSMPSLFLILAGKLGLRMELAAAPNHLFVRWRPPGGGVVNLETTSGALPARDEWIRLNRPMSDRSVASGMYMRSLSRHEAVAAMATTVLQHLMDSGRFEEAVAVSDVILRYNPRDGLTLANQGNAIRGILKIEFLDRYGAAFLIPLALLPRYHQLLGRNHAAFAAARALGWEPSV